MTGILRTSKTATEVRPAFVLLEGLLTNARLVAATLTLFH